MLTRRAAITVGVSAFMLFVALRYTSYVQHQQQEERKKAPPHRGSPMEDLSDNSPRPQASPMDPNSPTGGQQGALDGELLATAGVSMG